MRLPRLALLPLGVVLAAAACGGTVVFSEGDGDGGSGGAGGSTSSKSTQTGQGPGPTTQTTVGPTVNSTNGPGMCPVVPDIPQCSGVASTGTGGTTCSQFWCDGNFTYDATCSGTTCDCKTPNEACTCNWNGNCATPCCPGAF